MPSRCAVGDPVQTPLGKGIVREVRKNGRLLVEVSGRTVVLDARTVVPLAPGTRTAARAGTGSPGAPPVQSNAGVARRAATEVDLHGLTVEEALARADAAINDALLADCSELRLIHGRSGGRIRAALHRRLKEIPSVRGFRVDPRNEGVTIVAF